LASRALGQIGCDPQLRGRLRDPDRELAAIGDESLFEHVGGRGW